MIRQEEFGRYWIPAPNVGGGGGGGTPNAAQFLYQPTGESTADQTWQQTFNNLAAQGSGPAGDYYPYAQSFYQTNLNPGGSMFFNAQQGAQGAGNYLTNTLAPQLQGGATALYNQAVDPQQALYNRTQQQLMDQQNAINSRAGIASTPYGAGVAGQTAENFNIDWQNQQLQRLATGLQAASGIGNAGATAQQTGGALPWQTTLGMANAANSGLQNLIQTGNAQYLLPEQILANAQSYMGLGQSAASIANQIAGTNNQIGATNFGELASGLAGGSNLLFGNTLGNSGGLLGLAGLTGGGGGAAAGAGDLAGTVATGATDIGGGADFLAPLATAGSALP